MSEEEAQPSCSGDVDGPHELFIRHKVDKLDTLAGLAIKYNVTVGDIKRANGLLTDTAMFARETLLIPREQLPVGAQYSAWAAMIITRHGRVDDPAGQTPQQLLGLSGAGPGGSAALEQLRRFYYAGLPPPGLEGASGGAHATLSDSSSSGALADSGGLELAALAGIGGRPPPEPGVLVLLPDQDGSDERVRRRRAADDSSRESGGSWQSGLPPPGRSAGRSVSTGRATMLGDGPGGGGGPCGGGGGQRVGLLQKVKRVASQPSFGSGARELSNAASGVISSLSDGVRPGLKSLKRMLTPGRSGAPAASPAAQVALKRD